MWWNQDKNKPKDKNQEEYRKFFDIIDKYLIQYSIDDTKKEGWIVFIDDELDIDWVDTRTGYFTPTEEQSKNEWIAKLDSVHHEPCSNISKSEKLTFKKKLGVGYELVMVKRFDAIQAVIDECSRYVKARNKETSRSIFLCVSIPVVILSIIAWIIDVDVWQWHLPWFAGCTMGLLGACVSIWSNFGKTQKTGLSSACLHVLEATCRMLLGVIFAIVAICAIRTGIILKNIDENILQFAYGLVGFAAGFSERMVPSMIEKFVDSNAVKENGNVEA